MSDAATAVCPVCKERFTRSHHAHKHGSGRRRIEAQRFCGALVASALIGTVVILRTISQRVPADALEHP
jgi:hypothetical protein